MIKITIDIPFEDAKKIFNVFKENIFMSFDENDKTYLILENDFFNEISDIIKIDSKKENIDIIMEQQNISKLKNPFFGNLSI